ncbi:MAG: DUF2119 family protein [Candidatus Bathycorpusculaceae bacterium]
MFEIVGLCKPVRLIVGGVHGSEGIATEPILKSVSKRVKKGSVILCNLSKGENMSALLVRSITKPELEGASYP